MTKSTTLEVWAHRGGKGANFRENSQEAIASALENKFDKIELDVWLYENVLVLSHDEPAGDKHLLLGDALKQIDGRAQIYLDIKQAEAALPVHKLVKSQYSAHYSSVVFASFEAKALRSINSKAPSARLGLNYRAIDDHFIDIAQELGVEYVAFNWKRVIPNYFNIKQAHVASGAKYLAYTVNSPAVANLMKHMGMDGVITDYPIRFTPKSD